MTKKKSKKLWVSDARLDSLIEEFTIGKDRGLDIHLAAYDIQGTLAHIKMLKKVGLLTEDEYLRIKEELFDMYDQVKKVKFAIDPGIEDIHSQIEISLTERLGDIGKKIHSGRSRNDQVLLDLKLFIREQIKGVVKETIILFNTLIELSEKYKERGMPGYTHTQIAMPSSFGLWFAAFAESLVDDMILLKSAHEINNKNPLGSAAGYGSTFPLDRQLTGKLLGFKDLNYNSIYAQMGRGKSERIVAQAIASVADTLSRLANDIINFMSQNYNFIAFPADITTGSSIMPHKKNPDVFEIIRARCNKIKYLPNEIQLMTTNLTTGYHRDLQLVKENFIPMLFEIQQCINIMNLVLHKIEIKKDILNDDIYQNIYSVEAVNHLVMKGLSFRDAYDKVAEQISSGTYKRPKHIPYTHQGSIGNLCNDKIKDMMKAVVDKFGFDKIDKAIDKLLSRTSNLKKQ